MFKENKITKKTKMLIASILLVAFVAAGATIAYLIDATTSVDNTFAEATVTTTVTEDITSEPGVKKDVKITNTGNAKAFIRADVIITWQDGNGNIYGQMPVAGTDYEMDLDLENGWFDKEGFYYWSSPVKAGEATNVLIESIKPLGIAPEGYALSVEIIGSGIQAEGVSSGSPTGNQEGQHPVEKAWGVTYENGNIK